MADPTQLSRVGVGYVDNRKVSFHILNRNCTKEISSVNFILQYLDRGSSPKTTEIGNYCTLCLLPQENSNQNRCKELPPNTSVVDQI